MRRHLRATIRLPQRPWLVAASFVAGALLWAGRISPPLAAPVTPQSVAPTEPAYLTPVEIKLSANGKTLFVVCEDDDSLLAVDTQTKQTVSRAKVGHKPKGLALSPDGKTLYVSNEWSDTVSEVDVATFAVKRTLKTGWGPVGLSTRSFRQNPLCRQQHRRCRFPHRSCLRR